MKVWIDLANSPHVLFFAPILAELRARGVEVTVTARDFAQTEDLARLHGTNERLAISNYGEMINFYQQLLRNAAQPQ